MNRILEAARSTPGRAAASLAGIAAAALIARQLGLATIAAALRGSGPYVPAILALEAGILACSTMALRALYGAAAARVPPSQSVRAALIGYAVQGLVPAGRAAAEAARAALLASWVGAGTAGAAATRMQGVVLVANGLVSIPAAIVAAISVHAYWLPLAIAINAGITLALGTSLLFVARRVHVGAWLGRRFERAGAFGTELDAALQRAPGLPWRAIAWETAARAVQVVQNGILIVCVGGVLGLVPALCAEGVHLVGAAVGDLIPAQLGATEGNFALAADALHISSASAVSVALLAHLAQLVWVLVGACVPLVWRARVATPPREQEQP